MTASREGSKPLGITKAEANVAGSVRSAKDLQAAQESARLRDSRLGEGSREASRGNDLLPQNRYWAEFATSSNTETHLAEFRPVDLARFGGLKPLSE